MLLNKDKSSKEKLLALGKEYRYLTSMGRGVALVVVVLAGIFLPKN